MNDQKPLIVSMYKNDPKNTKDTLIKYKESLYPMGFSCGLWTLGVYDSVFNHNRKQTYS